MQLGKHKFRVNSVSAKLMASCRSESIRPVALCLGGVAMTSKFSGGALVGALMLAVGFWSYPANALTFQFSFNNGAANDPAQSLVVGIISGLQDNVLNQQAAHVEVTSNPAGFGVGEYVGNPTANSFSVSAGVITKATFTYFGDFNSAPAVTCCSLALDFLVGLVSTAGLTPNSEFFRGDPTNLTFAAVAETPLPAALPLFAGGLGALGLLGWRRKRKAI